MRTILRGLMVLLVLALWPAAGLAMWALQGEAVPIDRLITNVTRYVKDHPKDGQGYYVLARVHSLAYAQGEDKKTQVVNAPLPKFPPYESVRVTPGQAKLDEAGRAHLVASLENYAKATALSPETALYWMGRGWMAGQAAAHASDPMFAVNPDQIGTTLPAHDPGATLPDAGLLRRQWEDLALRCYQKVVDLALPEDLKSKNFGPAADVGLSYEALGYALEILKTRLPDAAVEKRIAALQEQRAKFDSIGRSITPIIFSLEPSRAVGDLLAPRVTTTFDLAGDGRPAVWPWLKPETCILVWDPQGTGRITSGRQLFGSATFWMFFENGYQALAALDDNADGYLSGKELDGLAVWRDANGNGVADPGEVVPVAQLGIVRIAVQPTRAADGTLQNSQGLTLQHGQTLPTYDWTPRSLAPRR